MKNKTVKDHETGATDLRCNTERELGSGAQNTNAPIVTGNSISGSSRSCIYTLRLKSELL